MLRYFIKSICKKHFSGLGYLTGFRGLQTIIQQNIIPVSLLRSMKFVLQTKTTPEKNRKKEFQFQEALSFEIQLLYLLLKELYLLIRTFNRPFNIGFHDVFHLDNTGLLVTYYQKLMKHNSNGIIFLLKHQYQRPEVI